MFDKPDIAGIKASANLKFGQQESVRDLRLYFPSYSKSKNVVFDQANMASVLLFFKNLKSLEVQNVVFKNTQCLNELLPRLLKLKLKNCDLRFDSNLKHALCTQLKSV